MGEAIVVVGAVRKEDRGHVDWRAAMNFLTPPPPSLYEDFILPSIIIHPPVRPSVHPNP